MSGKVYISHAREDDARCRPLLSALDAWGVDYWFNDRPQQDSGQGLTQRAQMAMAESDILLRICTRYTYQAFWMSLESGAFLGLQSDEHHQTGTTKRQLVNLILDTRYRREPFDISSVVLDATNSDQPGWVNELRRLLGLPPLGDTFAVARQILPPPTGMSRRQALALGAGGVVAIGLAGAGGVALLTHWPGKGPRAMATATPPTTDPHLRWAYFANIPGNQTVAGISAWPVVDSANNRLYIATIDGLVHALDLSTGTPRWTQQSHALGAGIYRAPALYNNNLYISSHQDGLFALDASTGASLWRVQGTPLTGSAPIVANNQLYVSRWSVSELFATFATVFDFTGKSLFDIVSSGAFATSIPAIVNNVLYIGADDGYLYALDATKAAPPIWRSDAGAARALALNQSKPFPVSSTPAVVNGVVYVGSEDSNVYAFDSASGTQLWHYQTGDQIVVASPVVVDGILYTGSNDAYVYALDATTGALIWRFQTGSTISKSGTTIKGVRATPTVANGVVYIGANVDDLYALDARTGTLIRTYKIGGQMVSAPAVVGSVLYATALDGYVYAFNLS